MRFPRKKKNRPLDLETFLGEVKFLVEANGEKFDDPQDDWAPVVLIERPHRELHVIMAMEAMQDKPSFCEWLARYGREVGATKIAFVSSTWQSISRIDRREKPREQVERQVELANAWTEEHGSLADYPGRTEAVVVLAAEPGKMLGIMAEIQRDGKNPPTLAEWESFDGGMEGLFADAIRRAVSA